MKSTALFITTKDQLIEFGRVVKSTNPIRRVMVIYKLPENFPRYQFLWYNFPCIFTSRSELTIQNDQLKFSAFTGSNLFPAKHVNDNFQLTIPISAIKNVDYFRNEYALSGEQNSVEWIRLTYISNLDQEEELLFCAKANFLFSITKKTTLLHDQLKSIVENN